MTGEKGKWGMKNDDKGHGTGKYPLDRLHPFKVMAEAADGPEDGIPAGGMTLEAAVGDQFRVGRAAFGYIPAVYFVAPQLVPGYSYARNQYIQYENQPAEVPFQKLLKFIMCIRLLISFPGILWYKTRVYCQWMPEKIVDPVKKRTQ
jgi:hypothetical protein